MLDCYCCSQKKFENCCQPFLFGNLKPLTAEQLMRSRYSAYATTNIEYILKTTQSSKRKFYDFHALENWAKSSTWQKLEIISGEKGSAKDFRGVVEFKAFYLNSDLQPIVHHEISNFVKELGNWFFVEGKVLSS